MDERNDNFLKTSTESIGRIKLYKENRSVLINNIDVRSIDLTARQLRNERDAGKFEAIAPVPASDNNTNISSISDHMKSKSVNNQGYLFWINFKNYSPEWKSRGPMPFDYYLNGQVLANVSKKQKHISEMSEEVSENFNEMIAMSNPRVSNVIDHVLNSDIDSSSTQINRLSGQSRNINNIKEDEVEKVVNRLNKISRVCKAVMKTSTFTNSCTEPAKSYTYDERKLCRQEIEFFKDCAEPLNILKNIHEEFKNQPFEIFKTQCFSEAAKKHMANIANTKHLERVELSKKYQDIHDKVNFQNRNQLPHTGTTKNGKKKVKQKKTPISDTITCRVLNCSKSTKLYTCSKKCGEINCGLKVCADHRAHKNHLNVALKDDVEANVEEEEELESEVEEEEVFVSDMTTSTNISATSTMTNNYTQAVSTKNDMETFISLMSTKYGGGKAFNRQVEAPDLINCKKYCKEALKNNSNLIWNLNRLLDKMVASTIPYYLPSKNTSNAGDEGQNKRARF